MLWRRYFYSLRKNALILLLIIIIIKPGSLQARIDITYDLNRKTGNSLNVLNLIPSVISAEYFHKHLTSQFYCLRVFVVVVFIVTITCFSTAVDTAINMSHSQYKIYKCIVTPAA